MEAMNKTGGQKKRMKTLYVSDLDGTLLRNNQRTSNFTNNVINDLTKQGMIFSYATARSLITAKKATEGILCKIPLIVYNGAFVVDNVTEEILIANIRTNTVNAVTDLKSGNLFYITCIDKPHKLKPLYEKYKGMFHCVYQTEMYTNEQWLEIMPLNASKANAIKQLKALLGCEKIVAFGDGKNDVDMFELADESYAVENAHEDLKKYATDIILSNEEDGVAQWLAHNFVS